MLLRTAAEDVVLVLEHLLGHGGRGNHQGRHGAQPEEEDVAVLPRECLQLPVVVPPAELVHVADDGQPRGRRRQYSSTIAAARPPMKKASDDDET